MKPISPHRKAVHTEKGIYDAQPFLPGLPKPRCDIIESSDRKTFDTASLTLPRGFKENKARAQDLFGDSKSTPSLGNVETPAPDGNRTKSETLIAQKTKENSTNTTASSIIPPQQSNSRKLEGSLNSSNESNKSENNKMENHQTQLQQNETKSSTESNKLNQSTDNLLISFSPAATRKGHKRTGSDSQHTPSITRKKSLAPEEFQISGTPSKDPFKDDPFANWIPPRKPEDTVVTPIKEKKSFLFFGNSKRSKTRKCI